MSTKLSKTNSTIVASENRCQICDTKLTLYPKDFAECPHCHQKVCRQCWSAAWASKSFFADHCAHLAENDGLSNVSFSQKEKNLNWDLPRIALVGFLAALAIGVVLFVLNLFVF